MSNRYLLILIISLLFMVPTVFAADIGYIVKNVGIVDSNIVSAINDLGYSYEVIDDSNIFSTDFSEYKMILFGDENIRNVPVNDYKTLFLDPSYYKGWSASIGSITSNQQLKAQNFEAGRITFGIVGEFYVYTDSSPQLYYMSGRKTDLSRITSTGLSSRGLSNYVVATKQNPRRVFFGITQTQYWTTTSEQLFKNSIEWTMFGDDGDQDGFFYDLDCDDNDPTINPDGIEIPYDGIDQDCDGEDLDDLDLDGYRSYANNGLDCDDSDPLINPDAEEQDDTIDHNCLNDGVVFSKSIPDVTWKEEEKLEDALDLNDYFYDLDGDTLTYSIYDTSSNNNIIVYITGSYVSFESSVDWYGQDWVIFKATDKGGLTMTSNKVNLIVESLNDAPECNDISDLFWDEEGSVTLDLNNYCSDKEDDLISYSIVELTGGLIVDQIDDSIFIISSKKDWFGFGIVTFQASDYGKFVITNDINVEVFGINDAPILKNKIGDLDMNEDVDMIEVINLYNYFSDAESSDLIFRVIGNSFLDIAIENGMVSIYPNKDFFGEEILKFSANDGEFITDSNLFTITVYDINEPPEFNGPLCGVNILEDEVYTCILSGSDFEGDDFWFTVGNEDNLKCDVNEDTLVYKSLKDYNGFGSCVLNIRDDFGQTEYKFDVNVLPVNDAPVISDLSPSEIVKVLRNTDQIFSGSVFDVDSVLNVLWFLDDVEIGFSGDYLFNQELGDYIINLVASDNEFTVIQQWNVHVGETNEFLCSEISGANVCGRNEICPSGDTIDSLDSSVTSCCSVVCVPKFDDIDRCDFLSSNIIIDIDDPELNDDFELNDIIDVNVDIENNFGMELDIEVEVYLYDITDDNEILNYENSVDIDSKDNEKLKFELLIPSYLDEDNKYAVFVKAYDEDEIYCSEEYVGIKIERQKHLVKIDSIDFTNEVSCGDYVNFYLKVVNEGAKDEDVNLKLFSEDLGISESALEFELEKYGDKNEVTKRIEVLITDGVESGDYEIVGVVEYNNGETFELKENLSVSCKAVTTESFENTQITVDSENSEVRKAKGNSAFSMLIISLISFMFILGYLVVGVIRGYKNG